MTKKKLLAKAKEMGLDVSDKLTKSQIQAAINEAESAEVEETESTEYEVEVEADTATEDDVVIEFTKEEAEEYLEEVVEEPLVSEEVKKANKAKLEAVAVAQENLAALAEMSKDQLYTFAKVEGISIHRGLSQREAYLQIKRNILSTLKRPK